MDLGIAGRKAIVCAASKGLGRACAMSLAREGVDVVITARTPGPLEATADEIRSATGVRVITVASDITTEAGRAAVLAACPEPDILVNNAGGPPPGDFREWTREHWIKAVEANMLTPIEMIKATVDPMMKRGFGRVINITSSSVKAPIEVLGLSNGARSGLHGFIAGLARKTVAFNVTINNLLPGPFETERMRNNLFHIANVKGITTDQARELRRKENPSGRLGDPAEFGDACAFLCSAQMGYVTGQNFLMDGGAYPGTY
ncbi:MAG: SDR family oxidoreductase [bacterium]|jgi:3-oxoacyl-[acyl-carrier protein] reductase|nr:SDR family oxidoreductase [Betaproteobacteria bacterium]